MFGCGCEIESKNNGERRMLIILLVINGVIFFAEIIVGIISYSTALIADSLDMLADASNLCNAIGLYTVSRSLLAKPLSAKGGRAPFALNQTVFLVESPGSQYYPTQVITSKFSRRKKPRG